MPGAAQEWPTAAPSGVPLYMRVDILSSIAIDKGFALTMAGWHASSIRSMLLPLRLSLWPDPVSILSNPLFGTPALVSCARFALPFWFFSCALSLTLYFCSLSQEYTVRDGRDAKPQMVHLITSIAYASREVGAALEARLLIRLSHAPVWRTAGIASGARAGIIGAR